MRHVYRNSYSDNNDYRSATNRNGIGDNNGYRNASRNGFGDNNGYRSARNRNSYGDNNGYRGAGRNTNERLAHARSVEHIRAYHPFGWESKQGELTYVEIANWCHAQHALPCCPVNALRSEIFADTSTSLARSTLHAWSARKNTDVRDNNGYENS